MVSSSRSSSAASTSHRRLLARQEHHRRGALRWFWVWFLSQIVALVLFAFTFFLGSAGGDVQALSAFVATTALFIWPLLGFLYVTALVCLLYHCAAK